MKKTLFSILLLSFFFGKAQENPPSFVIKYDSVTNELSLWKPKKRTPTALKKIRHTSFYTISSDVGTIVDKKLNYNWIDASKNNHEIAVKAYHINRPNDIQTKRIKVRKPTKLQLSYKKHRGLAPGVAIPLYAKIHFDDDTTEFVDDLRNSILSITSEDCNITKDAISIPADTALSKKSVMVKATYPYDSEITQSIEIPINYQVNQRFDFDGQKGYDGNHGDHGKNVTVYIKKKTDSLVNILIKTNTTQKQLITNLHKSKIHLDTNGGSGSRGVQGTDGKRGISSSDSRPAGNGHTGGQGGRGGDGGDGGFVQIYYQPSLPITAIQNLISVSNLGGKGGPGGNGGSGGRGGRSDDNKKALEILFNTNGGGIGEKGVDGDLGSNGKNGPPPSYAKLEKKEIDPLFENLFADITTADNKK